MPTLLSSVRSRSPAPFAFQANVDSFPARGLTEFRRLAGRERRSALTGKGRLGYFPIDGLQPGSFGSDLWLSGGSRTGCRRLLIARRWAGRGCRSAVTRTGRLGRFPNWRSAEKGRFWIDGLLKRGAGGHLERRFGAGWASFVGLRGRVVIAKWDGIGSNSLLGSDRARQAWRRRPLFECCQRGSHELLVADNEAIHRGRRPNRYRASGR